MNSKDSESILVISTGGTIDKVYFDRPGQYQVGEPAVKNLLTEANIDIEYKLVEICRKDSSEMMDIDREKIAHCILNTNHRKVLITHGTDTLVETAQYLTFLFGGIIVLTGAFRPAIFKDSDAPLNIGTALGALSTLDKGVFIAMSGKVFPAHQTKKNFDKGQFEYA